MEPKNIGGLQYNLKAEGLIEKVDMYNKAIKLINEAKKIIEEANQIEIRVYFSDPLEENPKPHES